MTTYATLRTRISNELDRTDLNTSGYVGSEVLSAIKHYARERFWFNEERTTTTTTAAQAHVAMPSDAVELNKVEITRNSRIYELERISYDRYVAQSMADTGTSTGVPMFWCVYEERIYLYPIPDATYTLTLSFVDELAALSADGDSNAWTTHGEELIRQRAKAALKINYLEDAAAKQEMMMLAAQGKRFYSVQEEIAYNSLVASTHSRLATGQITPTQF